MDNFSDPQPCFSGGNGEVLEILPDMAATPKIDPKWVPHKDEIYTVYIKENRTLPSTMSVFKQNYGLNTSVRKWKTILDSWKFSKNVKEEEMRFVVAKAEKRAGEEGKETVFYHEGVQIQEEKIERFKRRKNDNSQLARTLDPGTPQSIRYNTPSPRYYPSIQESNTHETLSMNHTRILPSSPQGLGSQNGTEIPEIMAAHETCDSQMVDIMTTNTPAVEDQLERLKGFEKRTVTSMFNDINNLTECYEASNSLRFLPYLPRSIMVNLIMGLNFDDVFKLNKVYKRLSYLRTDETICHQVLQTTMAYSKEALDSFKSGSGYASALRRAAKRREALRTASPFACATLGFADNYIYCCGILCYTFDNRMRILDLHNSSKHETVVSIPGLLHDAIHEPHHLEKGNFQTLYSNMDIICCIFKSTHPGPKAWLITFDINEATILATEPVELSPKAFAHHNHNLIYGDRGIKSWDYRAYFFIKIMKAPKDP